MAKNIKGGGIHIKFNASGTLIETVAVIHIGTTEDSRFTARYQKELTLTAGQITAIQNFIDNKFSELKSDEGIS